jgi:hypothetical protein
MVYTIVSPNYKANARSSVKLRQLSRVEDLKYSSLQEHTPTRRNRLGCSSVSGRISMLMVVVLLLVEVASAATCPQGYNSILEVAGPPVTYIDGGADSCTICAAGYQCADSTI